MVCKCFSSFHRTKSFPRSIFSFSFPCDINLKAVTVFISLYFVTPDTAIFANQRANTNNAMSKIYFIRPLIFQKTADLTYTNEVPTSVYNPSGMYGLKAMGVSFKKRELRE